MALATGEFLRIAVRCNQSIPNLLQRADSQRDVVYRDACVGNGSHRKSKGRDMRRGWAYAIAFDPGPPFGNSSAAASLHYQTTNAPACRDDDSAGAFAVGVA